MSLASSDPFGDLPVPHHIIPHAFELRVSEVRGAYEFVTVLQCQVHRYMGGIFDKFPSCQRVVLPENRTPPFGIAGGNTVFLAVAAMAFILFSIHAARLSLFSCQYFITFS